MVATPTTPDHLVSLSRRLLDEVSLICPRCDSPLTYDRSHIGGVAIVSGSSGITTPAPLVALSSIASAPQTSSRWLSTLTDKPKRG